jgi:hypothetical protein
VREKGEEQKEEETIVSKACATRWEVSSMVDEGISTIGFTFAVDRVMSRAVLNVLRGVCLTQTRKTCKYLESVWLDDATMRNTI